MQWGSQWTIATHLGSNPFYVEQNFGGTQFGSASAPNPFLRVRPPEADTSASQTVEEATVADTASPQVVTEDNRELIYATESFDRQQQDSRREVDSRWLRRHRKHRVPAIDVRLAVAFQKFLRFEELEFIVLVAAITDNEQC